MPLVFISLSETYINKVKKLGFEGYCMKIENYVPKRYTYYISPANSLCFMDGGIDKPLSIIIFPDVEKKIKYIVERTCPKNLLDRHYLPIGSSLIFEYDDNRALVMAPTMLLPQNVKDTHNAYYSAISAFKNISMQKSIDDVDILMTSLCCGYGQMDEDESITQIIKAYKEYDTYQYKSVKGYYLNNKNNVYLLLNEPNLDEQPLNYMNTEWKDIEINNIKHV